METVAVTTKKILVVDDEPDVASLITLILDAQGYTVINAADGPDALEKARVLRPDLVLLDVMLPKMDGYKVARILKFDENYSHIPIIMVTAKIREEDVATGLEMGASEYLTKPFDPNVLLARVREWLEKKDIKNG